MMFQVIVIVGDSRICRYVTCCSRDVSSSAITSLCVHANSDFRLEIRERRVT